MLNWAATFLVIALIAGFLGLSGVAGAATQIAWILFVDRKSTRLNSSHIQKSRMPSSA